MDNKKRNIKAILTILVIILGVGLSLGAVYFMYYRQDSRLSTLSSALVSIDFVDSGAVILNSSLPVIDDIGLESTPHNFTITNSSSTRIDVNIKLNVKNTTTFTSTEYGAVRYGLYINDELVTKDYVHSDLKLYTYENLGVGETISCKLYMWIDYYFDRPGKIFEASIKADGESNNLIPTTITLNLNGGTGPTSISIDKGATTYGKLPTPAREGYNFIGWFTAATGGTEVTQSTPFTYGTSTQTLYAHWEEALIGIGYIRDAIMATVTERENNGTTTYVTKKDSNNQDIYYLSGDNTTINFNYVSYSGYIWRVIAIYPDGTMKLATNSSIGQMAFDTGGSVYFYTDANNNSSLYRYLNTTFLNTLTNYQDFIVMDNNKMWDATHRSGNPTVVIGVSNHTNNDLYNGNTRNNDLNYNLNDNSYVIKKLGPGGGYSIEFDSTDILISTNISPIALLNDYEFRYILGYQHFIYSQYGHFINRFGPDSISLDTTTQADIAESPYSTYPNVHPAVYVKASIRYSEGSGTSSNPYVVA